MPLIDTSIRDIQDLLDEESVESTGEARLAPRIRTHDGSLKGQLSAAYLDRETVLEELRGIISDPNTSSSTKLRAIETVLKMDGALKDTPNNNIPPFIIMINDPGSASNGPNPILFPREVA